MQIFPPNVETFTNGEVALDFIKNTYSDSDNEATTTILLDINMPIMSGWEFLEGNGNAD